MAHLSLLSGLSPLKKLFFYFGLVFLFAGMGMIMVTGVVLWMNKIPLSGVEHFLTDYSNPSTLHTLMWMNNLYQIFLFVIPAMAFTTFCGMESVSYLMNRNPGWQILVVPFWILSSSALVDLTGQFNEWMIPAGGWMESWMKPLQEQGSDLVNAMLGGTAGSSFLLTLVTIGIIPALCEELAFRGVLQPLLARLTKNIHWAVWITAFVFSAIHLEFYSFLPRLLLGAMLGYLVIWTGSLWTSIFAHLTNNCLALVLYKVYGNTTETLETTVGETVYSYAISLLTFVLLTRVLIRSTQWPLHRSLYLGLQDQKT